MASYKIIHEKLKEPFNILAILSFIIAILSLFSLDAWRIIVGTLLLGVITLLVSIAIGRIVDWINFKSGTRFYRNWDEVPRAFDVSYTLEYITKKTANLEIIGRTCFRWLCGDEIAFERDPDAFHSKQISLQNKICEVIHKGASVTFVIQNPSVRVPTFNDDENRRLWMHAEASIASYNAIYSKLTYLDRKRLSLKFSNEVIENSMVRITEGVRVTRLIFDLSINFMAFNPSSRRISKPILAFSFAGVENEEYLRGFDNILLRSVPKEEFDKAVKKHSDEIEILIKEYSHHSQLRKDQSRYLAKIAARQFLAQRNSENKGVPPHLHSSPCDESMHDVL